MLDQGQKTFIEGKVRELGSLQAVKDFYCEKAGKLSNVDKYARQYAEKLYRGKEK